MTNNEGLKVVKRDGRTVQFDGSKIRYVVDKAYRQTYPSNTPEGFDEAVKRINVVNTAARNILRTIHGMALFSIGIESIQDIVIDELMKTNKDVGIHFATFRSEKAVNRIRSGDIEHHLDKLIRKDESVIHENANKDSNVFNTQRDLTAGVSAKVLGIRMLPPRVAIAHERGELHYHDLDYHPYAPMTNCCLIDFEYMFNNGFNVGNAEVEKPRSINTATAQMAQIIANVASSQYGGCSADRIDELLAPYARMNYDKHYDDAMEWVEKGNRHSYVVEKTKKDIYDAMQSLEYEINTLYTSNGQTPFVTFGFGLGTNWYSREIQKAILAVRIKGLGKERRTAIFPKLVFGIRDGVNHKEGDCNYDIKKMAVECATKRMYPDILNYDKLVELTGSYKAPMGCRSFLQGWNDENGNEVNAGRMNLGVVTLNLPRIALEAKGDIFEFWNILEERMAVAKEALVYRVQRVKQAIPENAPILYMNGAWGHKLAANESVNELFKNKRATVSLGYIGLYEVATAFYGSEWESYRPAKEFTLDILAEMKEHCDAWGEEHGIHFSVYGTPSESLTDRFCRMDKEKFGSIEDITDKDFYMNSFHYDTRKKPTPFEKLEFEMEYPQYTSGGFIHYCEYPNMAQNPKALEAVWDYAYDKVAYLGTNAPIDKCFECDFAGEFNPTAKGFECPECGNNNPDTCDVVKRTCGYLGNPNKRPMAKGRHAEIKSRQKHV